MSAPVIIGESCGCQLLEEPDLDVDQYRALPEHERETLDAWLDQRVESWREGAVTALAHGDGVLSLQRVAGGMRRPDLHDIDDPDEAHVAQVVLTLNTDRPPLPAATG